MKLVTLRDFNRLILNSVKSVNKIEQIKIEASPLEIEKKLPDIAREGWESISEDDVQRLKWLGLFHRTATPGYFMLRVRIPGGFTFSHQIKMLAHVARKYGNGVIDITTRMQVQIRHFKIDHAPEILECLDSVGLSSTQTGMDNVRNIIGCPVAGLHPKELLDASSIISALTQKIVGDPEYANLPRKFNLAISGCPDNCVHAESQDLALVPAYHGESDKRIAGFNVLAGGKLGSGGFRIASPLDVFVLPEEAVEVCAAVVLIFRDHGSRESRSKNRLGFLIDEWGVDRFRFELVKRLRRPLPRAGVDFRNPLPEDHLGIYRQKQSLMNYVGLKVQVGRIQADELEEAGRLVEKYGNGEIRLSPHQSMILPNIPDKNLGDLLEESLVKKFDYSPKGIKKGLVSCVGSDYCSLAAIETKTRAVEVADRLEESLSGTRPISVHWSGCPAACGNHLVADVGLLGKRAKVGGQVVDAVDVFVGGRAGPHPQKAVKLLENVPCDTLHQVLESIIPFHAREKMHPIKKKQKAGKREPKKKPQLMEMENELSSPSGKPDAREEPNYV